MRITHFRWALSATWQFYSAVFPLMPSLSHLLRRLFHTFFSLLKPLILLSISSLGVGNLSCFTKKMEKRSNQMRNSILSERCANRPESVPIYCLHSDAIDDLSFCLSKASISYRFHPFRTRHSSPQSSRNTPSILCRKFSYVTRGFSCLHVFLQLVPTSLLTFMA